MPEIKGQPETRINFNRRAVVAGAAWSLPVIAAAMAAPAAAASSPSAVVAFSANQSGLSWTQLNGAGKAVVGTGPTDFGVQTSSAAITGPISGTITISPNTASNPVAKGIGVKSVANGLNIAHSISASAGMANTMVTTFTLTAGFAGSSYLAIPITFGLENAGGLKAYTNPLAYTVTLVLKDAANVQIGQTAVTVISTNFS